MTKIRDKYKLGRRMSYKNSTELEDMIRKYFAACQHDRVVPNVAGLCNYLGICKKTFYNYLNNEDLPDYNDVIDRTRLAMEDIYVQALFSKYSSGAQFVLKNQCNWDAEENIKNTNIEVSYEDYLKDLKKNEY